ncbi:MAG: hypothetical protein ACKVOW_01335 [Chitinophagaceae bacterium]
MNTLLRYSKILTGIFLILVHNYGCKKSDAIKTARQKPEINLITEIPGTGGNPSSRIKQIHLDKDTVYVLSTTVTREVGEELIIDAGTVIKMAPSASITINPGAIISAKGNRNEPIVFTSSVAAGNKNNYWKGITINGKSVNNSNQQNGDRLDNSGSFTFIRIEFANLTLNNVGNRTLLENIQVSYANPTSAFIIKGGSFDARYLISYACGGPADFYFTGGYSGNIQYLLAQRHPYFGNFGNEPNNVLTGLYIENNATGSLKALPYTRPVLSNATVIGPNNFNGTTADYYDAIAGSSSSIVTARNAFFNIRNSIFLGYPINGWEVIDSLTASNVNFLRSEFTSSITQANTNSRTFYIKPGVYQIYEGRDFERFILEDRFYNKLFKNIDEFMLFDAFNYENPLPLPTLNSTLFTGARFDGNNYSRSFFKKESFIGAFGNNNWLTEWTNFQPLKTKYNVAE